MTMKQIATIYQILLMVSLLALGSCNKFLEDEPTDRIPADEAYNTLSDLQLNALGPIYRNIGGSGDSQGLQGTARGVWDLNTFSTDEAIIPTRGADWYDGGIWQNLFLHRFGNVDFTGDTWNYLFAPLSASMPSRRAMPARTCAICVPRRARCARCSCSTRWTSMAACRCSPRPAPPYRR